MSEIKKIGMYTTDEILEHLTEGEGRGFLGRSMYDAIIDYITNLQKEVRINNDLIPYLKNKEKSLKKQITNLQNQLQQKENIIKEVREYINNHLYMESTGGIQHPTFDGKMNSDTDGFEILEILDLDKGE